MTISHVQSEPVSGQAEAHRLLDVSAQPLFAAAGVLCLANGGVDRVYDSVSAGGWVAALDATFGISVLVWVAAVAAPVILLRAPRSAAQPADWLIFAAVGLLCLAPGGPLSWLALSALGLHMLWRDRQSGGSDAFRRAGWLVLAIAGAMFWGRVLLMVASGPVLGTDAVLIGWMTGSEQAGNTVAFLDGSGYVWIAPGCSSLSNVSLATVCWVLFAQLRNVRWSLPGLGWWALACASAIAVNVVRIALMVRYSDRFDLLHGPVGAAYASWISLAAMVVISAWGTRQRGARRV